MFAIKITQENLDKIQERLPVYEFGILGVSVYLGSSADWYLISGYVDREGRLIDWAILPAYIMPKRFEYDAAKAEVDWDQIVRKEGKQ